MYTNNSFPAYKPPKLLVNGDIQTIYAALFRKINEIKVQRVIIDTPDDDFLEADLWQQNSKKAIILSHGLEGDSRRPYILGMAHAFFKEGWDIVAWNYRGCSGRLNKQKIMYHSGATYDLHTIVEFASEKYEELVLIGFSLGGNLTLKYAGEYELPSIVKKIATFSVPLDLRSGAIKLHQKRNFLYERRFLKSLKAKMHLKTQQYPEIGDMRKISKIKSIYDFDNLVTAPIHGFKNADDYYHKCSSRFFFKHIKTPTLVVNAQNDPFLTAETLDNALKTENPRLIYEITEQGGHVGYAYLSSSLYWSEKRALHFVNSD